MSALLTEEAVRKAMRLWSDGTCGFCHPHGTVEEGPAGATWTVDCEHGGARQQAEVALRPFLRHHATEGREALVERVARILMAQAADYEPGEALWPGDVEAAEAIVTVLFGEDA